VGVCGGWQGAEQDHVMRKMTGVLIREWSQFVVKEVEARKQVEAQLAAMVHEMNFMRSEVRACLRVLELEGCVGLSPAAPNAPEIPPFPFRARQLRRGAGVCRRRWRSARCVRSGAVSWSGCWRSWRGTRWRSGRSGTAWRCRCI
jgi:hypothetical protein